MSSSHAELEQAINSFLRNLAAAHQASQNANDQTKVLAKYYEGYLFTMVLCAAASAGYTVTLYKESGSSNGQPGSPTPTSDIVLRAAPGYITQKGITYARLQRQNQTDLEVHAGIRIKGITGVAHEADVAVIRADEANNGRASASQQPQSTPSIRSSPYLILHLEAKYYKRTVSLGPARNFVGMALDYRAGHSLFITPHITTSSRYLIDSTARLASHFDTKSYTSIHPRRRHNPNAMSDEERRLFDDIVSTLKKYRS